MSSFKERVDQQMAIDAQAVAQARRDANEELRRRYSDEADTKKRRLELALRIMSEWDGIGVPQILREINSDIWKNYGKYDEDEFKDGEVVTQRNYRLTATCRSINEKWKEVQEWRFGRHWETWEGGMDWENGTRMTYGKSSFGPYKETVALELAGYDLKTSKSKLGVEIWTGGAHSDNGYVDIYDTDYNLSLPTFNFDVNRDDKQIGTRLQLRFNQSDFNIGNVNTLLDSVLLASSVERARQFVSKMKEQEDAIRSIESRIGERKSI